jgi:signal transduction histidine kinase
MDVAWIDKKIEDEAAPVKGKLKNIITLLDGSNQSVRRILNELKPNILDEYGLLDAMDWHGKQFTASTGVQVTINASESEIKLGEDIATCIFRVYQESLTNVTRHSGAKNVLISLEIIGDTIVVIIEDDGKGFDVSAALKKGTFGLLGMNERVRSLNGTLDIQSVIGKGTTILMKLPFRNNK